MAKLAPHDLRRTCAKLCRRPGVNWNKFSSCSATSQFKQQSDTWAVSNEFGRRSMTVSASNHIPEPAGRVERIPGGHRILSGLPTNWELDNFTSPLIVPSLQNRTKQGGT